MPSITHVSNVLTLGGHYTDERVKGPLHDRWKHWGHGETVKSVGSYSVIIPSLSRQFDPLRSPALTSANLPPLAFWLLL